MCLFVTTKSLPNQNVKINRYNWVEKDSWSTDLGQVLGVRLDVKASGTFAGTALQYFPSCCSQHCSLYGPSAPLLGTANHTSCQFCPLVVALSTAPQCYPSVMCLSMAY